jgi:hypothetical protein
MNPMTQEQSEIANTFTRKFQVLHDAFTDLACDAAQFHSALIVNDMPSRDLFVAFSRIVALSDQLNVGLTRLREDVLAVEAALADPREAMWAGQFEAYFEAWLAHAGIPNSKLN